VKGGIWVWVDICIDLGIYLKKRRDAGGKERVVYVERVPNMTLTGHFRSNEIWLSNYQRWARATSSLVRNAT
jgi:hypothetical protein